MSAILYAESSGTQFTDSSEWANISALEFILPPLDKRRGLTVALITVNLPNPYAAGNDNPGGYVGVSVNGNQPLVSVGCFTTETVSPPLGTTGRIPTTLVVRIDLQDKKQHVAAMWKNIRGSRVVIDTPASMSAVIGYYADKLT